MGLTVVSRLLFVVELFVVSSIIMSPSSTLDTDEGLKSGSGLSVENEFELRGSLSFCSNAVELEL